MNHDKLNDEQLEELKIYFAKLDEIRGIEDRDDWWTDEELRNLTSIYGLIDKLGKGDPIRAAYVHAKTMIGLHREIELSGGDQSKAVH